MAENGTTRNQGWIAPSLLIVIAMIPVFVMAVFVMAMILMIMVVMIVMVVLIRAAGHLVDHDRHLDLAGILEIQHQRELLAGGDGLLCAEQHQMQPAGLEQRGIARRDLDCLDRAHLRDTVLLIAFMQLDRIEIGRACAKKALILVTIIGDRHVNGGGTAGENRAGHRVDDHQIADLEIMGHDRSRSRKPGNKRKRE